jgi:hypothetical protein
LFHNKSHAYLWKCICGPLKCYHVTSHHRWRRICLSTDSFKNWQDIKPKVGIFKSGILISFVTLNWYFVYYKVIYLSIRNTTNYIYHLLEQTLKESLTQVAILTSDLQGSRFTLRGRQKVVFNLLCTRSFTLIK